MVKKIVITGGIGSGKTSVTKILQNLGYCIWDADIFAREALFLPEVEQNLKSVFGTQIYTSPGQLDRVALRQKVFSQPEQKKILESILHPAIAQLFRTRLETLEKLCPTAWVFYEAALIVEAKRVGEFDTCVLVTASESVRIKRLQESRSLSLAEIQKIIKSQTPDEEKKIHSHFIIENNKDENHLKKSVADLLSYLAEK